MENRSFPILFAPPAPCRISIFCKCICSDLHAIGGRRSALKRAPLVASIAATILIWGFVFIPLKRLTNGEYGPHPLPPEAFLALRFVPLLPLYLLVLLLRFRHEDRGLVRRDAPWIILMGLLMVPGYHLPLNFALRTSLHTGLTSLILNLTPALTYFLAVSSGQERPSRRRTAGVLVAFAGIAIIFGEEIRRSLRGGSAIVFSWSGAGLLLFSAFSWAAFTVIGRRLGRDHDPRFTFAASGSVGIAVVLAASPILLGGGGVRQFLALDSIDWIAWAYASFLAVFFAAWSWITALRHLEASRLASAGNLVPLLAHLFAATFLPSERDAFTPSYLAGASVALLGTWLVVKQAGGRVGK